MWNALDILLESENNNCDTDSDGITGMNLN